MTGGAKARAKYDCGCECIQEILGLSMRMFGEGEGREAEERVATVAAGGWTEGGVVLVKRGWIGIWWDGVGKVGFAARD